jgi:hypothetical protein
MIAALEAAQADQVEKWWRVRELAHIAAGVIDHSLEEQGPANPPFSVIAGSTVFTVFGDFSPRSGTERERDAGWTATRKATVLG